MPTDIFQLFQNNPAFQNLSKEKLDFLTAFASSKKPTQMKEMAPFLLAAMGRAKKNNIQFSPSESELLIQILKSSMSPEEQAKTDQLLSMMRRGQP